MRQEEDADNEEDEEGKDDVRKETWEVQHLALGTRIDNNCPNFVALYVLLDITFTLPPKHFH